MASPFFYDVTPCRSVDRDQQFEKTAVAIFTVGESRHYSTLKMEAVVTLKYCSVYVCVCVCVCVCVYIYIYIYIYILELFCHETVGGGLFGKVAAYQPNHRT